MNENPIKVSASFSYKFQPKPFESAEIVMHISQIPVDASDDELEDARMQAASVIMKMMGSAFKNAQEAIDSAKELQR